MKWITREHPRVDRVACPWLIEKFIDKQAEFIYVPSDQVAAERGEQRDRIGQSRVVCDDEERPSRRHAVASFDDEPAGRVVDDPRRALMEPGLTERAVVRDEAASDVIRDRPDQPANDLHAQPRGAADERLGAFPRDDARDLTTLGDR